MKQTRDCRYQKTGNIIRAKYMQQSGLEQSLWKIGIFMLYVKSPTTKFLKLFLAELSLKLLGLFLLDAKIC